MCWTIVTHKISISIGLVEVTSRTNPAGGWHRLDHRGGRLARPALTGDMALVTCGVARRWWKSIVRVWYAPQKAGQLSGMSGPRLPSTMSSSRAIT